MTDHDEFTTALRDTLLAASQSVRPPADLATRLIVNAREGNTPLATKPGVEHPHDSQRRRWLAPVVAAAAAAAITVGTVVLIHGGHDAGPATQPVTPVSSPTSAPSSAPTGGPTPSTPTPTHSQPTTSTTQSTSTTAVASVTVVLRPVTSTGRVAAGYSVTDENDGSVDCGTNGGGVASRGAVSGDILACAPDAENVPACWKDATAGYALCLRNPFGHAVVRIPSSAGFATSSAPAKPQPLGLLLDGGITCTIRVGGAWNSLAGHAGWAGTYECGTDSAVWAPPSSDGVDTATASWTVHTGPISGTGPITVRHVVKAYFVGTAS